MENKAESPVAVSESSVVADDSVPVSMDRRGAVYQPLHVTRTVKIYPIQEHELYSLDDLGRNSKLWTSIGSGAISFAASCFWEMSQAATPVAAGAKSVAVFLVLVSAGSFFAGWRYSAERKSRLEKIISESK